MIVFSMNKLPPPLNNKIRKMRMEPLIEYLVMVIFSPYFSLVPDILEWKGLYI